jgi:very-short-patch-repair endonuclease
MLTSKANFKNLSTKEKFSKYLQLPYNPKLKAKAQKLRKSGNLSEVLFWDKVKNKQLLNLDFERQKIIGNYIVDFYCAELSLVIEIDGESHDFKGEYDNVRDSYLRGLGLKIVHVEDIRIKKDLDGFMTEFYGFVYGLKLEDGKTVRSGL